VPGANASGFHISEAQRLRIVVTEPDDVRIKFEAACFRIGKGSARQAFSLALNKEGRKAFTAHRRALAQQSSIPRGAVAASMKFKASTRSTLETRIVGSGRHLPLSVFGAKQFSYGVRAKVWGRVQTYRSAFVVGPFGNNAFKRTSKARFPIEQLWGPAVPVEMLRDEALAAWEAQHGKVLQEAQRLMALPFSIGVRK
jgi:hypothetical protein